VRRLWLVALVLAACSSADSEKKARLAEAEALVGRLPEAAAFDRLVALGEAEPLLAATRPPHPDPVRGAACLALGRVGGAAAEARLQEIATTEPRPFSRWAYAGLAGWTPAQWETQQERDEEARPLLARLDEPDVMDHVVALAAVGPLVDCASGSETGYAPLSAGGDAPDRPRLLACLALGRIGGAEARDALVTLLGAPTPKPVRDGALHLYAAAGLTLLHDPGAAVDLVLNLSKVNPNDNVAALASEAGEGVYYTVDAQISDALLSLGLWDVEEDLVEQMRRHDFVRVLIDAYAVLRRHTGLDLPFRYNGSYADREMDADAWLARLRETRAEREQRHPFDDTNPHFKERCGLLMHWLGGVKVNDRYVAEKALLRLGRHAIPFLVAELQGENPSGQREAALMLGRIGRPEAAPALRAALTLRDADARAAVVAALTSIRDADARAAVLRCLQDEDGEVRANAARYLEALGGADARPALAAALAKEDAPGTATAMACALFRLGDAAQVDRLLQIFMRGEQLDREAARDALVAAAPAWKGDPEAPEGERAAAAEGYPRQ